MRPEQPVIHRCRPLIDCARAGELPAARVLAVHALRRRSELSRSATRQTNAKFPDAQQLRVSSSHYQAAEGACAHLLPNAGQATPAASAQILSKMVRFSQCMRSHGVPNWPDPTSGPDGTPGFNLVGIDGIPEQSSPQFQNAIHGCGHLVPHALGGIRVRSQ